MWVGIKIHKDKTNCVERYFVEFHFLMEKFCKKTNTIKIYTLIAPSDSEDPVELEQT